MAAKKTLTYSFTRSIPAIAIACAAISVAFTCGCSTLGQHNRADTELSEIDSDLPTYKVIFASNMGGEPTIYTGRITKPMTVHDALVESGAVAKYPGMKIDLARKVPGRNEVLRLDINYDSKESHVVEEWNYAVHPGDEILVRKEDVGALSTVFKTLGG